jgi:NDP-sugar pyrophosphorylase family protein
VIGDAYLPALAAGERIGGVVMDGYFEEHSTPDRYLAGNVALLRAPERLRTPPGPLVGIDPHARVAADARIVAPVRLAAGAIVEAGATVGPDVVVGERARVAANARLERVVVWSDAVAEGRLTDAVVTPEGVVDARG